MLRKRHLYVFSALCATILVGCQSQVKEASLVSNIGEKSIGIKEIGDTQINLVDPTGGKIVKQINLTSLGYFQDKNQYKLNIKKIANEIGKQIDQKMIPSRMTSDGIWEEGKPSYELLEKELVEDLMDVGMWERSYSLPIVKKQPIAQSKDANRNSEVIGKYVTEITGTASGKIENIRLSANNISGVTLGKGDRFSFNALIGDTTPDKGYQIGKEIVAGKLVDGYGGGVCQTSSTLYNAADQAGLKMIERYSHSKPVGYVPIGSDATIAYPYFDLVFENTNDELVKIFMKVEGNRLTAEIHRLI
ncbi:VanW family protein [Bacillus paramycoides]|uniref:VanW family protein n=1 Tax=Bacillus paramycoides TaxID=2026194 RepID=UPI002E21F1E5|nr:VanW family protein [Bacillus paramycoides]